MGYLPSSTVRTTNGAQLGLAPATAGTAGKAMVSNGDGTAGWAPVGGGGGGVLGQLEAWASTPFPLSGVGERGVSDSDLVWGAPYSPDGIGATDFLSTPGSGKLLLAAGWYNIAVWLGLAFPAGAGVAYVRCAWNIGNNLAGNSETYLAKSTDSGGREVFMGLQSFGAIYSNGTRYLRPSIRWNLGTPAPESMGTQLGAVVTKVG